MPTSIRVGSIRAEKAQNVLLCQNSLTVQEKELSVAGRNWGEAIIDGSTLVFNVAGKPALRIPLTDVGQVHYAKTVSHTKNPGCKRCTVSQGLFVSQ